MTETPLPPEWFDPPAKFSLAPFWFLNDELRADEIVRQLGEFQAHGVEAVVLHPRVGLPRWQGWMSDLLLAMLRFAIEEAERRGMWVMLYDEGMYPSGSASGQVVAENPAYQCRGLERIALADDAAIALPPGQTLVADVVYKGQRYAIIDRPVDAVIRGLHFIDEDADYPAVAEPPEDEPPAADLLNSEAVAAFIHHGYERYYAAFGDHFGTTIRAIFTDEPNLLGRSRETGVMPGTSDILRHVNAALGYDFTPFLPALWDAEAPESIKRDYLRAVDQRLEMTYYAQLYDWCEQHGIALTGHPAEPDATNILRFFHVPGQDIVWRFIEPDQPSALAGRQSTQAKAAASAMLHNGRRRNANEFCGAYGDSLTFGEMRWLAHWLLVRGCNLLIPHAFYYSVRGPRRHERPPDVGLHSAWWDERFTAFGRESQRLCWLNTDSEQVCAVAILGEQHNLPWRAAQDLFQHQIDFNYLDADDLLHRATIDADGVSLASAHYRALILDGDLATDVQPALDQLGSHVIRWSDDEDASRAALRTWVAPTLYISPPAPGLRVRHVRKAGFDWYILFNETSAPIAATVDLDGEAVLIDPYTDETQPFTGNLSLSGHELRLIAVAQTS